MTGQPDTFIGTDRDIRRRTRTYGVGVVVGVAVMVTVIVWLGSRRGECFAAGMLVCSGKDRRLLFFLPTATLVLCTVGAYLRASPRWHRMRRLCIRPYLAWILAALTVTYGLVSFALLF